MQRSGCFLYSTSTVTLKFRDKLYGEFQVFLKYHAVSTGLSEALQSIEIWTEISVHFTASEAPAVRNGLISQKTRNSTS
jgi:hypothetical protein